MRFSPWGETDFIDRSLEIRWVYPFSALRTGRCRRGDFSAMNSAAHGRRLASPVRLTLASELGERLDGAWWPRTGSIARELPELIDALSTRLGRIIDISVNWSPLEGSPDLDSLNRPRMADPCRAAGRQRLMLITGSRASANLLVVPCRTSSALAVMVLRLAAAFTIEPADRSTQAFRTAGEIVRIARAESARCALRPRGPGLARVVAADSAEGE
ncbi:MAG: DUF5994 family protein [Mycobacterium sp.]|uniref:DUF5994 family protein n=1 Tax=Mycobacterium sp. TaxID=1785 RepID=UPI0026032208|nr:DUF5994 family protein [Mycobacterium sp.]MDI3312748.1 DUF5994 family protein [Mycobacterium sp.]